jgi:hypothetical protein
VIRSRVVYFDTARIGSDGRLARRSIVPDNKISISSDSSFSHRPTIFPHPPVRYNPDCTSSGVATQILPSHTPIATPPSTHPRTGTTNADEAFAHQSFLEAFYIGEELQYEESDLFGHKVRAPPEDFKTSGEYKDLLIMLQACTCCEGSNKP